MQFKWSDEQFQTASRDVIAAVQFDRLRKTLGHAYRRVPHYDHAFLAAGVHPDDLRHPDDLARFPFTTKADLRANYPFNMFAVPLDEVARIHASSGTTGKPTVVGYTKRDIETWAGLVARSLREAGGCRGSKVHVAFGYGLFTGGLGLHYGAEALGCTVIPVSGGMTSRQVQLINDFRPDIICVTPSYLLSIADEFDRQGLDTHACSLKAALCGAEPWSEGMRSEIEQRMGISALDIYGLSEVIGPGVGQELAGTRDGLTIWEDHFLPEIIDPETGAVLPDGAFGELVLTSLTKEAMPLIRYRTRDLTRLLPGTASHMRRIDRIRARSDDMMIIRGVNVFPSQIEELVLACGELSSHHLIEIDRLDQLDIVRVKVEARAARSAENWLQLERKLEGVIKSQIGISAKVQVVPANSLARSEGKVRRVIDSRPKA